MRNRVIAAIVAAGTLMATFAAAAPQSSGRVMKDSFLPENTLRIPIRATSDAKGITEAQFNAVLDKIQGLYAPIISSLGGKLLIERRWTDETVNAYAQRQGNVYKITMFGGLARHEAVTQDGFALVACHELGHHLGGAPKSGGRWASNEGQADYYGNLKCLRRVFNSPGVESFTRATEGNASAAAECAKSFSNAADQKVCVRTTMAGVSLGTLLNILGGGTVAPTIETPDTSVVTVTDDAHPAAQCRLDTYFQAALCARPWTESMSETDPNVGSCTLSQGFAVGMRPLCWYKPTAGELSAEPSLTAARASTFKEPATYSALKSRDSGSVFSGL